MYISVPSYNIDYKVMVRCATYNHSKYIQETLNGFAIQNTDFPFICIVVDDASSDGNQEVIRRYANENCNISKAEISEDDISKYIRVSHKRNANCFFLFCLLKVNLYGKPEKKEIYKPYRVVCRYEALCEGDDYWIDPLKLQKQVDFLESNPEYSICFHSANVQNVESIQYSIQCEHIENRDYSASELFENWIAPTASFLYKKEALNIKMNNRFRPLNGDIILLLKCAKIGKLRGFSDCMSVYRVQNGGVTYDKSMKKTRYERYPEHYLFIKDNFSDVVKIDLINKFLSDYYLIRAKECSFSVRTLTDLCMFAFVYPKNIYLKLRKLFKLLLGGEKKN